MSPMPAASKSAAFRDAGCLSKDDADCSANGQWIGNKTTATFLGLDCCLQLKLGKSILYGDKGPLATLHAVQQQGRAKGRP